MIKIIVSSQQEKDELIEVSRRLHDPLYMNAGKESFEFLQNLHNNPDSITVDWDLESISK